MIKNKESIDKIEDLLWTLKNHCDDRARFYKNMNSQILHAFDRLDN